MTTNAVKPAPDEAGLQPGQELAHALAEALHRAVSAQANTTWTGRVLPQAGRSGSEEETVFTASARLSGSLSGQVFLTLDAEASSDLLTALSSQSPGDPAQAWLTLCSAAGEILLASSKPAFASLALEAFQLATAAGGSQPLAQLELIAPSGTPGAKATVSADADLFNRLTKLHAEAQGAGRAPDDSEDTSGAQIERVIDVPLAVTLRFGERHLTLREVLALSTGSLVELDRQVEEPVDLVLGDRLIARGEVVIVDGNYGLRVTEVVQGATNRIRRAHAADAGERGRA